MSSSSPVPGQETSWLPMLAVPGTQVLPLDLLPGPPQVTVQVVHDDQQLQSELSTVPAENIKKEGIFLTSSKT